MESILRVHAPEPQLEHAVQGIPRRDGVTVAVIAMAEVALSMAKQLHSARDRVWREGEEVRAGSGARRGEGAPAAEPFSGKFLPVLTVT